MPTLGIARLLLLLTLVSALLSAGCGGRAVPPGESNLSLRDTGGTEVARGYLVLPKRLPGPGQSFGGAFKLTSSRGDFPPDATSRDGRYQAFVGDNGSTLTVDLNPTVADNNVTLGGQITAGDVRGSWAHSTFAGAKPRGSFVLDWPRK